MPECSGQAAKVVSSHEISRLDENLMTTACRKPESALICAYSRIYGRIKTYRIYRR